MGADWFADGNEDIVIAIYNHETGILIKRVILVTKDKLKANMALSIEVSGVTWR